MSICLSHGGTTMYSAASPARKILVGTVDGVVTVEKGAAGSWAASRTQLKGCHISVLLVEPKSGTLFAGVHKGGIQVSTDGGNTWEQRERGLTQKNIFSMCASSAGTATRIYAGTEPAHLFVSEDLGENWTELPSLREIESVSTWTFPAPPHQAHVTNLAIDDSPQTPSTPVLSRAACSAAMTGDGLGSSSTGLTRMRIGSSSTRYVLR